MLLLYMFSAPHRAQNAQRKKGVVFSAQRRNQLMIAVAVAEPAAAAAAVFAAAAALDIAAAAAAHICPAACTIYTECLIPMQHGITRSQAQSIQARFNGMQKLRLLLQWHS